MIVCAMQLLLPYCRPMRATWLPCKQESNQAKKSVTCLFLLAIASCAVDVKSFWMKVPQAARHNPNSIAWSVPQRNQVVNSRALPGKKCRVQLFIKEGRTATKSGKTAAFSSPEDLEQSGEHVDDLQGLALDRVEIALGPGKGNVSIWQDASMEERIAEEISRPISQATQPELLLSSAADVSLATAMKKVPEQTGHAVWPSAAFLGQFLVSCPSFVRGKSVVELGCGVGLPGICAGLAGAKEVLFTDLDPVALQLAKKNVEENGVECPTDFAIIDWGDESTWPQPLPACDIIIAAEVLYFQDSHASLVKFADALLDDTGRAFICEPRKRMFRRAFMDLCIDEGFEIGNLFDTPEMVLLNMMRLVAPEM